MPKGSVSSERSRSASCFAQLKGRSRGQVAKGLGLLRTQSQRFLLWKNCNLDIISGVQLLIASILLCTQVVVDRVANTAVYTICYHTPAYA